MIKASTRGRDAEVILKRKTRAQHEGAIIRNFPKHLPDPTTPLYVPGADLAKSDRMAAARPPPLGILGSLATEETGTKDIGRAWSVN